MRKNIFALFLGCVFAFSAAANTDIDSDITDWSYVENGTIYTNVKVENAAGVIITTPGSEAPVALANGINTIKVPVAEPTFEIRAAEDYILTVKIGDKTYSTDDAPVTVDCTKPAPIYITTTLPTGSSVLNVSEEAAEAKYFDLTGAPVQQPEHGKIYIKVTATKATKVIF